MHQLDRTAPQQTSEVDEPSRLAPHAPPPSELQFTELVLPHQANHYGTLFGPNALALLGKVAFLAAARYSQQSVVMAAARQIDFLKPVPVGALLNVHARISRVGRTSMSVHVRAAFDMAPGTPPEDVLRGEFEMVTVDELGRPSPVRPPQRVEDLALAALTVPAA